ncbi:MAG: tagaturonate reductase [Oscillospiraceae bacterium]|jgi:tagaturonate reductase|nr:tagaturonate reductase [Oscillospiraceae bacterium]
MKDAPPLHYDTLRKNRYEGYLLESAPERVLQFGEGNFLRAFADYFIDVANEKAGYNGKVVVVQPILQGLADTINAQEGLYTLYLRGFEAGRPVGSRHIVSSISRCINPYLAYQDFLHCAHNPDLRIVVSNTTEAGIVFDETASFDDAPAKNFPGKLTRLLYERFSVFGGDRRRGLIILSCELIDDNGKELKQCVLRHCAQWGLEQAFIAWLDDANLFCSTLVDRITTGYPKDEAAALNEENGYADKLLDAAEPFGLWVIEGPAWLAEELPFARAGLPVIVCDDQTPYKRRKVRILNGAHTSMSLGAYLAGKDFVRDCVEDDVICRYIHALIFEEIIPTLTLPEQALKDFALSVIERFRNPFIDHSLLAIALNSTAKWKARVLPSVKAYAARFHKIPALLLFSFAAYAKFYSGAARSGDTVVGRRGDETYAIADDAFVLSFFLEHAKDSAGALIRALCRNAQMWDEDLSQIPGFEESALAAFTLMEEKGLYEAIRTVSGGAL